MKLSESKQRLLTSLYKNDDCLNEDKIVVKGIEKIPTPSPSLNIALGGGFPVGYMMQLAGAPSSGKSFLSFVMAKSWQDHFKDNAFILVADFEHTTTIDRCRQFGIDTDKAKFMIWKRSDNSGGAFFDFLNDDFLPLCKEAGMKPFIILDSKDSIVPPQEMGRTSSEMEMAGMARFLKRVLKRTCSQLAEVSGTMAIINQLVTKLGVLYGDPSTTSGGNALKHNSVLDIWFKKVEKKDEFILNKNNETIGHKLTFKIDKNKIYIPNKKGTMRILYSGQIIDPHLEIFEMVKNMEVVERPNLRSWNVDSEKPEWCYSSKQEFIDAIKDNEKVREELLRRCKDAAERGLTSKPESVKLDEGNEDE